MVVLGVFWGDLDDFVGYWDFFWFFYQVEQYEDFVVEFVVFVGGNEQFVVFDEWYVGGVQYGFVFDG